MKYLLLALPLGVLALPALGQKIEYSGRATVGFGGFRGDNSTAITAVNLSNNVPNSESSRAVNPYGSSLGVGGGLALRAQYVAKFKALAAFDLGYDFINSKADVNTLAYNSTVTPYTHSGSGAVHLFTHAITAFGGVGYRLGGGEGHKLAIDLLVGPELAYAMAQQESGSGTDSNGSAWSTSLSRTPANRLDFRLRGDVSVWVKQVGLVGSYSYGFTNYQPGTSSVRYPDTEIKLLRVGLAYRFK
ncbi:MAG: hypothetical protein ACRYFK_19040 [Janthinobacterium lividum]